MSEEQKKAFESFREKTKEKKVHINICLWATAVILNSANWQETLNEIETLLDNSKDCDEFALRLSQGYDTPIGENGTKLSGGERQRISIARALLKNAPIVLLDEATASLDVENETQVQEALSRLLVGKTVIVIAHRMRTVMNADKIVVLKEGRVVEQGTPEILMKDDRGLFRRMVSLQNESAQWVV